MYTMQRWFEIKFWKFFLQYTITRRNGIPFNADLTDQSAGWSRVVPGCGGSCPHPISNYLESKILKNDGNCLMALVADE